MTTDLTERLIGMARTGGPCDPLAPDTVGDNRNETHTARLTAFCDSFNIPDTRGDSIEVQLQGMMELLR